MSMSIEEILAGDATMQRTPSTSYFHDFLSSPFAKDSGSNSNMGFNMEDTLEFNDLTLPASFQGFLEVELSDPTPLSRNSLSLLIPSVDLDVAFKKGASPVSESVETTSLLADDDDDEDAACMNPSWERDLEKLISEFDGQVPIDEKLKEELILAPVKDFNRRAKAMRLDGKSIQYLKLQRKRVKNRLAAIRSRSRKDVQVVDLQEQIDTLVGENQTQKQTIRQLQHRLEAMEREMKTKGRA